MYDPRLRSGSSAATVGVQPWWWLVGEELMLSVLRYDVLYEFIGVSQNVVKDVNVWRNFGECEQSLVEAGRQLFFSYMK